MISLNKFPDNSPETTLIFDFDNEKFSQLKMVFLHRKELAAKYTIDTDIIDMYNNLFFENINVNLNYKLHRQL